MESTEPSITYEMDEGRNSISSPETTSNPGKSHETVSVFGETSCGEPLIAQHIRINFAPTEIDNDQLTQNKCVSFWNFINNSPEIQDLLVLSEPNKYATVVDSRDYLLEMSETDIENRTSSNDRTAVSVLELIEGKGLIDKTFETKLPQSRCSMGDMEYRGHDSQIQLQPVAKKSSAVLSYLKKVSDEGSPFKSAYAKNVCKKMEEWDSWHVKILETPRSDDDNTSKFGPVYMFTISCYALHPLALRFVTLWRNVQIVSDFLTNLLWCLCCQWCCDSRMPLSNDSSVESKPSIEAYKFVDTRAIDAGRSSGEPLLPQHLVVDFTPQRGDTPEVATKCEKFWQFVNSQDELKKLKVHPDQQPDLFLKEGSSALTSVIPDTNIDEIDDYPTVHVLRRLEVSGGLAAAFTKSSYRCNQ